RQPHQDAVVVLATDHDDASIAQYAGCVVERRVDAVRQRFPGTLLVAAVRVRPQAIPVPGAYTLRQNGAIGEQQHGGDFGRWGIRQGGPGHDDSLLVIVPAYCRVHGFTPTSLTYGLVLTPALQFPSVVPITVDHDCRFPLRNGLSCGSMVRPVACMDATSTGH